MDSGEVNHSVSLLRMLREMKRVNFICDFELKIGDDIVPVHKAVLAASSNYFVDRFQLVDSLDSPMQVDGVDADSMQFCLDYMYTGFAHLTMNNIENILHASNLLQLDGLYTMCAKFLIESLTIGNCLVIGKIAKNFNLYSLVDAAERFSVNQFQLVIRTGQFQALTEDGVLNFLKILVRHEERWKCALEWAKSDFNNRKQEFEGFLRVIIPGCSFHFLFYIILKETPIMNIAECSKQVYQAIFSTLNVSHINEHNCFVLLEIGLYLNGHHSDKFELIYDYIAANFDVVCREEEFKNVSGENLFKILQSPNSKFFCAQLKWESVVVWIKSDQKGRWKYLYKLIRKISWTECPFSYFLEHVFNNFLVQSCKKHCIKFAATTLSNLMGRSDISIHNWFTMLQIAHKHNQIFSNESIEKILSVVASNFEEITYKDEFGRITTEDLVKLLQCPEVLACSDRAQWDAIIRWLGRDSKERYRFLRDILGYIDFTSWSFNFLYGTVYKYLKIIDSEECLEITVPAILAALGPTDVSAKNFMTFLVLARQHGSDTSDSVVEIIRQFILENLHDKSLLEKLASLEVQDIMFVLESSHFHRLKEESRWECICKWLDEDNNRQQYLLEVFDKVELNKFTFRFLDSKVLVSLIVEENEEIKRLTISTMLTKLEYCHINLLNWPMLLQTVDEIKPENSAEIKEKLKQFMSANFGRISGHANFRDLSIDQILELLQSPEIISTAPKDQINGVIEWARNKPDVEDDQIVTLFSALRIEAYPFNLLQDKLINEPLVRKSKGCSEIFLSGLQQNVRISDLTFDTWFVLLSKVRLHGRQKFQGIVDVVLDFAASRFMAIQSHYLLNELEIEDVKGILRCPTLKACEEDKVKFVIKWVSFKEPERWADLPDLFGLIDLGNLSNEFIKSDVYENQMVMNCDSIRNMLIKALITKNGTP